MNFALFGTFKEVANKDKHVLVFPLARFHSATKDGDRSYLNVIRCQVAFHVAVLLFGRGRGRFVGGWEVSPVKRAKR